MDSPEGNGASSIPTSRDRDLCLGTSFLGRSRGKACGRTQFIVQLKLKGFEFTFAGLRLEPGTSLVLRLVGMPELGGGGCVVLLLFNLEDVAKD